MTCRRAGASCLMNLTTFGDLWETMPEAQAAVDAEWAKLVQPSAAAELGRLGTFLLCVDICTSNEKQSRRWKRPVSTPIPAHCFTFVSKSAMDSKRRSGRVNAESTLLGTESTTNIASQPSSWTEVRWRLSSVHPSYATWLRCYQAAPGSNLTLLRLKPRVH